MDSSTSIVEAVGTYMFGIYHVVIIIVLINMLIAMMSHSFEDIQVSHDVAITCSRNGTHFCLISINETRPTSVPAHTPERCHGTKKFVVGKILR